MGGWVGGLGKGGGLEWGVGGVRRVHEDKGAWDKVGWGQGGWGIPAPIPHQYHTITSQIPHNYRTNTIQLSHHTARAT